MANPLPESVQPAELASREQVFEFKGKVGDFERLCGIVDADLSALEAADRPRGWKDRPVTGRLAFRWLDARQAYPAADGSLSATLAAVCQRCLEGFEMPLDSSFSILFANESETGGAAEDTPGYESWTLDNDSVRLQDVVEESLIMALPLAPVHRSPKDCGNLATGMPTEEADEVRPFADLRAQMDEAGN